MRAMIIRMPMQTGNGGVRHVEVSLPYIDFLVSDWPAKYGTPESLPPLVSRADTQPIGRVRLNLSYMPHPRVSASEWREIERSLGKPV
jgi:hypothetical protein